MRYTGILHVARGRVKGEQKCIDFVRNLQITYHSCVLSIGVDRQLSGKTR